jgi:hypothetical protein
MNIQAGGVASPEKRVGCVLTMRNGPAAGRSTRIVGYNPTGPLFQIVAFDDVPTVALVNYVSQMPAPPPLSYIINGPPFTGTGVGYNTTSGRLDWTVSPGVPAALLLRPFLTLAEYQAAVAAAGGRILANPDYTAADHQHPFLAMQLADGTVPIPSFHRPELVNYWYNLCVANPTAVGLPPWPAAWTTDVPKWKALLQPSQYADPSIRNQIVAFKRRILLRPLPDDQYVDVNRNGQWDVGEPMFAGGNPAALPDLSAPWFNDPDPNVSLGRLKDCWELGGVWGDPARAPYRNQCWDVDTDGDGIPDAIWVDFGFPVRALPDGRLVKPLVAPLIVDLDGRLNLNAHGSFAQWPTEYDPVSGQQFTGPFAGTLMPNGASTPLALPRGEGYGPADIRLAKVVTDPTQLRNLLLGNGAIEGRYGELGRAATPQAGVSDSDVDPVGRMSRIKHFEYPNNYPDVLTAGALDPTKLTSFGSPPDLWGRGSFALDYAGQPFYVRPTTINGDSVFNGQPVNWWANEVLNNPYRLDLSRKAARTGALTGTQVDNPFTPAELERVLRPFDADAGLLAQRLVALAPGLTLLRHRVTTDSYDVPTPGGS